MFLKKMFLKKLLESTLYRLKNNHAGHDIPAWLLNENTYFLYDKYLLSKKKYWTFLVENKVDRNKI